MQNLKYSIFILSSFLLINCGEDFFDSIVEIEVPEHQANLAITAHLTPKDEVSLVHVTHTLGILDDKNAEAVKDAKVELYKDGQLIQSYQYRSFGKDINFNGDTLIRDIYAAEPIDLLPNVTYELRVNEAKYGELVATQQLPTATPIISATYEEDGIVDVFGERADEIAIKFQDVAAEKNYYLVEVIGWYLIEGPDTSFLSKNPAYLSPADVIAEEGLSGRLFLSDATINGKEYELKIAAFNINNGERLKKIEVTLYSISEDRYLYEKSLIQYQDNQGNPFAEPVVIHENVSDGNGIFTMSTADVYTIEF